MKRNMLAKKLTAALLTGTMVMSMGMTAFAGKKPLEPGEEKKLSVTKNVTTDGNTPAPQEVFQFAIGDGDEQAYLEYETENGTEMVYDIQPALKDEDGRIMGLSIVGAADFTDSSSYTTANGTYTNENAKIVIDEDAFATADLGVYHYTLSEIIPETDAKYPGITYDETQYHIYVFVREISGERTYNYIAYKDADGAGTVAMETEKTDDLSFTNDYGMINGETHDVTISKVLGGNQPSADDEFIFTITINPDKANEKFNVEYAVTANAEKQFDTIDTASNSPKTYTIQGSGYIKITGLTDGDEIKVDENDYSGTGYTTTYAKAGGSEGIVGDFEVTSTDGKADFAEFKVTGDGARIEVTNTRNASTPTGIAMTFAPYAVMVAFAGVFAVMFLRKKREDF